MKDVSMTQWDEENLWQAIAAQTQSLLDSDEHARFMKFLDKITEDAKKDSSFSAYDIN